MLEVKKITKKFGSTTALREFSYQIKPGSIHGLVGYNGAGKTTLMKIICGIYRPEEGNVLINKEPVYENQELKRRFFMVQDIPFFLPQSTMNGMAMFYSGFYPEWSSPVYKKLVQLFGLNPTDKIHGFSKGMQRQASLIFALSSMPDYLLMDESFDGLDLSKRNLLKQLIFAYQQQRAVNIIISSHNLKELEGICDHICMIKDQALYIGDSVEQVSMQKLKYLIKTEQPVERQVLAELEATGIAKQQDGITFYCKKNTQEVTAQLCRFQIKQMQQLTMSLEEIFLDQTEESDYDFKNFFQ